MDILLSVDMKFRNEKKFRCGIPVDTGLFQALIRNVILHKIFLYI
jgi:hypothetical protein